MKGKIFSMNSRGGTEDLCGGGSSGMGDEL